MKTAEKRLKLAVLASGEGTTFEAIAEACRSWLAAEVALVVSSRADAGVLTRAQRRGVPFAVSAEGGAELAKLCRGAGAELVCLAGYLKKLDPAFLKSFPDRVLNVHPALLPSFGGKGMYGEHVHRAVLESGTRVSGCTVHLADEVYDHGPVVLQAVVPVVDGDTLETLSSRVREAERWLYPQAIGLFAEGRVRVEGRRVRVAPAPEGPRVRRALLSVSDKTGLVEFGRGLSKLGVELVATGGTAKALEGAGLPVRPLSTLTASPEMLGGRVKTLHPKVHGGILFRRKEQAEEAGRHGLEPIDLVAVNLYPFEKTAARHADPFAEEVIEDIDIGGPAMIRSAAKNHEDVLVVTEPAEYPALLSRLEKEGYVPLAERRTLAAKAFDHTARYDRAIADRLGGGRAGAADRLSLELVKVQELRYGENPHQRAALYREASASEGFRQLHGKELSYNNLLDADSAFALAREFAEPAVAIVKHNNPCGVGEGSDLLSAWTKAWEGDPVSGFGGVVASNRPLTADAAKAMAERFLEVVLAPSFEPGALELLRSKKSLRVLEWTGRPSRIFRNAGSAILVQDPDERLFGDEPLKVVSRREPTSDERRALEFAWRVAKHVRSNAIVLSTADRTVGIGAGQMSRVDSVRLAGMKSEAFRKAALGAGGGGARSEAPVLALASDAFFPFRDGLDEAAALGVTAVIQPGGSVRDAEVLQAADERGLAMLFTGMRHFKH